MKRSRETVPLSELSAEQIADIRRRHPDLELPVADRDVKPANVLPADVHRAVLDSRTENEKRYRSKTEAAYAEWLYTFPACVWAYEHASFALPGKGTRYRPDFGVRWDGLAVDRAGVWPAGCDLPHFDRYLVEVKGTKDGRPFWRSEAARLRALTAAAVLWDGPERRPLFVAWRVDGKWMHERVEVRP